MTTPLLRYVSLLGGRCGLTTKIPSEVIAREGRSNVVLIRNATANDLRWFRGMGRPVPSEFRIDAPSTWLEPA